MSQTGELPTLPTKHSAVHLTENNAPRSCTGCGDDAFIYVFITPEQADERLEQEWDTHKFPVNAFLCGECFRAAPRVESLEELVSDAPG